jgi:hypothetical protein
VLNIKIKNEYDVSKRKSSTLSKIRLRNCLILMKSRKKSENNSKTGMKRRLRVLFIPRERDEILTFISYLARLN